MKKFVVVMCVGIILMVAAFGASAETEGAWIPALGSFVLPGMGQLLNNEIDKAIIHFGVSIAIWTLGFYSAVFLPPLALATPALALGWHIYSGFDAFNVAKEQGFTIGMVDNDIGFAAGFQAAK